MGDFRKSAVTKLYLSGNLKLISTLIKSTYEHVNDDLIKSKHRYNIKDVTVQREINKNAIPLEKSNSHAVTVSYTRTFNYEEFERQMDQALFERKLKEYVLNPLELLFWREFEAHLAQRASDTLAKIFVKSVLKEVVNANNTATFLMSKSNLFNIQKTAIRTLNKSYEKTLNNIVLEFSKLYPDTIQEFSLEYSEVLQKFDKSFGGNELSLREQKHKVDFRKPVCVNLHNNIFKNNAYEVWEYLKEKLKLENSSRTDLKFIYEEMKKDGLIHRTVNQTFFLDWVNQTYSMEVQKTSNYSRTPLRLERYQEAKDLYQETV